MKGWISIKNGEYFIEYLQDHTKEIGSISLHPNDVILVDETFPILPKWNGEWLEEDGYGKMVRTKIK